MTGFDQGSRKLACGLIEDALRVLKQSPPSGTPPRLAKDRKDWERRWREWAANRARDVAWFLDASRSARWCEIAGLDYDAVVSRLSADGLLYSAAERSPVDMTGRPLVNA